MLTNTFIHWTQEQYLTEIREQGISRGSAAYFALQENDDGNIDFTIATCIYHAIGIFVQHQIINASYRSFSDYYINQPQSLPVILLIKNRSKDLMSWGQRYIWSDANEVVTYPYFKIDNTRALPSQDILGAISFDVNEILDSENTLQWVSIRKTKSRFFRKTTTDDSQWTITDVNLTAIDLVDERYMYKFTSALAHRTVEKMRKLQF